VTPGSTNDELLLEFDRSMLFYVTVGLPL